MEPAEANQVSTPSLVERLAKELGGTATASRIYGTPIEKDGVTIIPVARAAFGFGGGSGRRGPEAGGGGGGGVRITPVGYVEIKNGSARFSPIWDPLTLIPLVATGGFAIAWVLRGLSKLVRRG